MDFRLDRDLPIPLGTQLRGLIEYGIGFGELKPGARLPSVREMAEQVGVAPMTVAQVYGDLKKKGLLQGRAGSGTFVGDVGKPQAGQDRRLADLRRRIDLLVEDGLAMGLKPGDLAALVGARLAERRGRGRGKHIVMAGNFQAATAAYARTIAEVLGPSVTVEAVTIDALARDEAVRRQAAAADIVLTLAHRRGEVVALLPGSVVVAVSFIPSGETRRALASIDPLARVLVVSIFPEFTPLMKAGVHRFAPHVPDIRVVLRDAPDLPRLLRQADVLVYATGAQDLALGRPHGTAAFEYRHTPDPADIRRVVLPLIGGDEAAAANLEEAS